VSPEIAGLQAAALMSVFRFIISEAGSRTRKGQSQAKIADELYPLVENLLDELDRWFRGKPHTTQRPSARPRRR
jgi:hypothetical protein